MENLKTMSEIQINRISEITENYQDEIRFLAQAAYVAYPVYDKNSKITNPTLEEFDFKVEKVIVKLSKDAFDNFDVYFPPFASDEDVEDMKKQLERKLPNSNINFKKIDYID